MSEDEPKLPITSKNKKAVGWILEYASDHNLVPVIRALAETFEDIEKNLDSPETRTRFLFSYIENSDIELIASNVPTFIQAIFAIAPEEWVLEKESSTYRLLVGLFFQVYLYDRKAFSPLFKEEVLKPKILHTFRDLDISEIGLSIEKTVLNNCTEKNYKTLKEEQSLEGFMEMLTSYVKIERRKLAPCYLDTLANAPHKQKANTTPTPTTTNTQAQFSPQIDKNINNNNNNKHKHSDINNNNHTTTTTTTSTTYSSSHNPKRPLNNGKANKQGSSEDVFNYKELKTVYLESIGSAEEWELVKQGASSEIEGFLKRKQERRFSSSNNDLDEETQSPKKAKKPKSSTSKKPTQDSIEVEEEDEEEVIVLDEKTNTLVNKLTEKSKTLKGQGKDPLPDAIRSTTRLQKGKIREEDEEEEEEEVEEIERKPVKNKYTEKPKEKSRGKRITDNVSLSDEEHQEDEIEDSTNDRTDTIESGDDFIPRNLNSPKKAAVIKPLRTVGGLPDRMGNGGSIGGIKKTAREGNQGRRFWTQQEVQNLLDGVTRFGVGQWSLIEKNYNFNNRKQVDLKDKYRNL
eukprot:TRINITY_DN8581_c0_g1_i1.p1 TRINITY_DN8581_c0_g1~~TRINITY_DN8581_c0_g1_i1.p1  ORF type:complete len:573 (-),score=125.13 TRINITY_DN8581_c0_g1_i1:319-2037(-)